LNVVPSPQGRPVVIMAGTSPRGLRFAVGNADMVIAHKNSIEDMRTYTTALRAMLADAGRDPSSCKVFFSIKPVMGDTPAMAAARWEQNLAKTSVEEGLADLSSTLGHDLSTFDLDKPIPPDLPVQALRGKLLQYTGSDAPKNLREAARHEAMFETFPICGTPEQVADVIEEAAEIGGADGFHFRAKFGDIAYLTEITTRLVPILQRRGLARSSYSGTTLREHLFEF
jgi:alkanesulfonate monooxygenase SsuD/methylene tetrahydromethanopterin reductase-like flavin-dependent oxidoreductase (luciferase family)